MMIYLLLIVIIKLVSSVQYNQPCTFSLGTCDWSIGRRWHIMNFNDENKILIADVESKEDKRNGFTDTIMSPWLHLSSLCSFNARLTFQFSIRHEHDLIEIYLIQKNRTRTTSLGQWKGLETENKSSEMNDWIWQRANLTVNASEEFQIDLEIRHVPNTKNDSEVWFAIDDIMIENCPSAIVNTTTETTAAPVLSSTASFHSNEGNGTLFNMSHWKLDDFSSDNSSLSTRQTLLTLILYLFCALIALTLLIILFSVIMFTYRKHCCGSKVDHRRRFGPHHSLNNRVGIQVENIDRDHQTVKAIDPTVRPCFE